METYYEVTIKYSYQMEDEKGKLKTKSTTQKYLVKAKSVTEVEKIAKDKIYTADAMDDFDIVSTRVSKIIAVL